MFSVLKVVLRVVVCGRLDGMWVMFLGKLVLSCVGSWVVLLFCMMWIWLLGCRLSCCYRLVGRLMMDVLWLLVESCNDVVLCISVLFV